MCRCRDRVCCGFFCSIVRDITVSHTHMIHIYDSHTWFIYMIHIYDSHIWVTGMIQYQIEHKNNPQRVVRDMTVVRCGLFLCSVWLNHICVTWRIHICVMTIVCVCDMTILVYRALLRVYRALLSVYRSFQEYIQETVWIVSTWLIHICMITLVCVCDMTILVLDLTHSYLWRGVFVCVIIYMCDISHLYVWYDSISCVTWLIVAFETLYAYRLTFSHVCLFTCLCIQICRARQIDSQIDRQVDR